MNDTTSSLYEHIKNRLPPNYGYGNDGQVIVDKVKSQAVWQQTLREDHPGDVGIFVIKNNDVECEYGFLNSEATVQVAVVCKAGELNKVTNYLKVLYNTLKTDTVSSGVKVYSVKNINLSPIGMNSEGNQMAELNIKLSYKIITT